MKKEFLLSILALAVALMFFAGCAPAQKVYVCPDGREVLNAAECEPIEKETEPKEEWITPEAEPEEEPGTEEIEEEEEEYEINITDEVQELFAKVLTAKTLKYLYAESPNPAEDTYIVSRHKIKIDLKSRVKFSANEAYDTVYLDLDDKEAVAYCENRAAEICLDRDKPYNVDYEDYVVETPFDWLAMVTKAHLTGRSQTLEDRLAQEVEFEIKGEPGTMYLDSFFSVPVKIMFNGVTYEFRDLVVNEATEKDLEHQFEE